MEGACLCDPLGIYYLKFGSHDVDAVGKLLQLIQILLLDGLVLRFDNFQVILILLSLLSKSVGKIVGLLLVEVLGVIFIDA